MNEIDQAMRIAQDGNALDWPYVALTLRGEVQRLRTDNAALRDELRAVYRYLANAEHERDALWESITALRAKARGDAPLRGMGLRAVGILEGRDSRFRNPLHKIVARYIYSGR